MYWEVFVFSFFFNLFLIIYFWLCWVFVAACRLFSSWGEQGPLFIALRAPLIAVASLVVEHGLKAHGLQWLWHTGSVVVARGLQSTGSVVMVHGPSCSAACGIFLDQGSNPCPLHWQADSQPLRHQASPRERRVLTTGPPGKSPCDAFKYSMSTKSLIIFFFKKKNLFSYLWST